MNSIISIKEIKLKKISLMFKFKIIIKKISQTIKSMNKMKKNKILPEKPNQSVLQIINVQNSKDLIKTLKKYHSLNESKLKHKKNSY